MSDWFNNSPPKPAQNFRSNATLRQQQLTKPPGSLGQLEELAVTLAALQSRDLPACEIVHISIFAADHGVADSGVSAFPQAVTVEMVRNFARGGAAVSVLAKQLDASLEIVNVGTATEVEPLQGVVDRRIAAGTADFSKKPAMTHGQLKKAFDIGRESVQRAHCNHCDLFIAGDMGIANTTSASAIACQLLDIPVDEMAGPGTGLDDSGIAHKSAVIEQSLILHRTNMTSPLTVLQHVGGFEIAAMTGAYVAAAQAQIPILVDGFISTAAALCASIINSGVRPWMMFAHASAEPGHRAMMKALDAQPLLNLGMRLGEGSGAAVAVSLLKSACALHNDMATFADAGVSEKI